MAETAIVIGAVAAAASTAMAAAQASSQASAQSKASQYNADVLKQSGIQATNTAAANEATSLRQSQGALGEQAAALGESNIGTGGSVAAVERQSATNAQMDALNIWYGGELERNQAFNAASLERYNSLIEKRSSDNALYGGFAKAGTQLLMGGLNAYGAKNPGSDIGKLGFGGPGTGTF